jgi:quercetin dioxygenase-like cupin family protein
MLPEDNPTEVICEIEPASRHPEYSLAIAAIKQSVPHYHKLATEEYSAIEGELELKVDEKTIKLDEGDVYSIKPPQIHSAMGNFTLVKITSKPGWTPEDHILI